MCVCMYVCVCVCVCVCVYIYINIYIITQLTRLSGNFCGRIFAPDPRTVIDGECGDVTGRSSRRTRAPYVYEALSYEALSY
jgi:hypothetical protein